MLLTSVIDTGLAITVGVVAAVTAVASENDRVQFAVPLGVWHPGESADGHAQWRCFRHTFEVQGKPKWGAIKAVAPRDWTVYLDGKALVAGKDFFEIQRVELAEPPAAGQHVLAVASRGIVPKRPHYTLRPFVWVKLKMVMENGRTQEVVTGKEWLAAKSRMDGWNTATPTGEAWRPVRTGRSVGMWYSNSAFREQAWRMPEQPTEFEQELREPLRLGPQQAKPLPPVFSRVTGNWLDIGNGPRFVAGASGSLGRFRSRMCSPENARTWFRYVASHRGHWYRRVSIPPAYDTALDPLAALVEAARDNGLRLALGAFSRYARFGADQRSPLAFGGPNYDSDFYFAPLKQRDAMGRLRSMVERFKDEPAIGAWVVHNEPRLMANPDSVLQQRSWHQWLERRYGGIEAVNTAWRGHPLEEGQRIDDIPIRALRDRSQRACDEARWLDDVLVRYVQEVARTMRSWDPNHLVTVDGCSWSYWVMRDWARLPEIDFLSWHDYETSAIDLFVTAKMVLPPDKPLMVTESRANVKYVLAGLMAGVAGHLNFSGVAGHTLYRRADAPALANVERWANGIGMGHWDRDRPNVAIRIDYRGPAPIEVSDFRDRDQPQMKCLLRLARSLLHMGVRFDVIDEHDDPGRYGLVLDVDRHTEEDTSKAKPFVTVQASFPGWLPSSADRHLPYVLTRRDGTGQRVAGLIMRFPVAHQACPPELPPAPFGIDLVFQDLADRAYTVVVLDPETDKVIRSLQTKGPQVRVVIEPATLHSLLLISVIPAESRVELPKGHLDFTGLDR